MKLKAVIFDMDGVVLDSERLAHAAWRELAEEEGLPDIDEVYAEAMGHNVDEISALFRERYGSERYSAFREHYGTDIYPAFRERTFCWIAAHTPGGVIPLREGARELLIFLKEKGIRIGLATATERAVAQKELEAAGVWKYFDCAVTGDQVSECKPDPEIYLKACELLNVDPEETYGVEDGRNGILALHAAGMPAVLTEDQYHPEPEIAALCEAVLPTLEAAKDYLEKRLQGNAKRNKETQMIQIEEYRGHIRNWRSLCEELGIDAGLPRKEREQEILKKGYEAWGTALPDHLYGMFAFALWDEAAETLYCVRDQFGTKPFYYYQTEDGGLLYGTMIRDILQKEGFVKELNESMLQIYLSLTYAAGEDTFFKGLKKLMPGHFLTWKRGELTIERYFAPEYHPDETKSLEDWADEIHTTLQRIMPEVKEESETAESFLSGGVDSSYVLAMSDAQVSNSCGYDDERFDESPLAAETARILGRENKRCRITPEQFFGAVPYVMENMEQPLGDASAIVFAIACRATAEHTKLCYSGEGADEFFGGYNMYRNAGRYGDNLKNFYVGNTNIMKEEEKERILQHYDPEVLPIGLVRDIYKETEGLDPLTRMADIDIRIWLEGDIYLNVDKMSEAAGLEIRMPLTDRRIFDIASRLPARFKVNDEQNKVAFRTAAAKVLPEEIAFRKKLGFVVPIRYWMADDRYNAVVKDTIFSDNAGKFFKPEEIRAIWEEYKGGNSDLWRKVWTIYTFLVWYELYFTV